MKFIVILTLIFTNYTATASSLECSKSFEQSNSSNVTKESGSSDVILTKELLTLVAFLTIFWSPLLLPVLVLSLGGAIYENRSNIAQGWRNVKDEKRKRNEELLARKTLINEAENRYIQQLESWWGISNEKATKLSSLGYRELGFSSHFDYRNLELNSKSIQQVHEKIKKTMIDWGFSKNTVLRLLEERIEMNDESISKFLSPYLSPELGLSKKEIEQIILAVKNIRSVATEIYELFRQGFTKEQIIQILELGVSAEYKDTPFKSEKVSDKEKQEILKQAGFTDEEITLITASGILSKTKSDIFGHIFATSTTSAFVITVIDGLQWLVTGSSFIW